MPLCKSIWKEAVPPKASLEESLKSTKWRIVFNALFGTMAEKDPCIENEFDTLMGRHN
jgi:hypothetical protein